MRKLFAILMLCVCLFNLAGYSFLFNYYIYRADRQAVNKVEADLYAEANLKEIKIKLNMPYLTDWPAYEAYQGEAEINGVHYNYVKRKVSQDTLYLLCLPNEIKTQLSKLKNDYAVKANDLPAEKNSKNPLTKKGIMLECGEVKPIQVIISLFGKNLDDKIIAYCQNTTDNYVPTAAQPPERFTC